MKCKRVRVAIRGAVQGVGFRPFVYRLATELRLAGWVSNSGEGVLIEAEGPENRLAEFLTRLQMEKPQLALIQGIDRALLEPVPYDSFEIHESFGSGRMAALILPDIATCRECLRELFDPKDRRYLYPFTNCTHCGPRFSIIEALPYDRANTSMKQFAMCAECEHEYHDPHDRRFHAQPNACPKCGPRLELWDADGRRLNCERGPLLQAASAVRDGRIVAIKGIGGFQLIADARNEETIRQLRARKRREERPFAVMFPSISEIQVCCRVGELERQLLFSPASPIVLLKAFSDDTQSPFTISGSVAPGNPSLGVMLPYTPLHHLLLRALDFPVVATSGNLSDEPICTDEHEALQRLHGIADVFLVHDRLIVRHMDDSVVRLMLGREMVLRRARGYAPLPVRVNSQVSNSHSPPILALGAHFKNTVALNFENQAFVSQHIGNLETAQAFSAFKRSAGDLPRLYQACPQLIAHDLHPEYLSTRFAAQMESVNLKTRLKPRSIAVQHHYAHVLSCMADNELTAPVLGVAWDGTGFGIDGTIWGGEFLRVNETSFDRLAHFRRFSLPGGEAAVKQPRRAALGLLYEMFGTDVFRRNDLIPFRQFSQRELRMLERMLAQKINSPATSSAGRFFDAVASIAGLRQTASFEGQAAMELEFAVAPGIESSYPVELSKALPAVFDWQPMIAEILKELDHKQSVATIAAKVHNTLVELIVALAHAVGETNVVLSGGCFQNQYLTERAIRRLRDEGFVPHWHHRVPPNDGGIALGQLVAALRAHMPEPAAGCEPDGPRHETSRPYSERGILESTA